MRLSARAMAARTEARRASRQELFVEALAAGAFHAMRASKRKALKLQDVGARTRPRGALVAPPWHPAWRLRGACAR
jgi:hypothetical protein